MHQAWKPDQRTHHLANGSHDVARPAPGRRRFAGAIAAVGFLLASPLTAQTSATLGVSTSIIEYEGFLASGAATLTPALRFDAPDLALAAQGSWTVFESGNHILQATTAAGWLTRPLRRWRVELSGAAGASKYADEPAAGHALARARLHRATETVGGWGGITAGFVSDGSADLPVELELGAWTVVDRLMLVGTVTRSQLGDDYHVDLLGAARWTSGALEIETRIGMRPWTRSEGEAGDAVAGVFGELSALVSLGTRVAVAVGAGSYAADPVRRILGARYLTAGLRLALLPTAATPPPSLANATLAAVRARVLAAEDSGPDAAAHIEIRPDAGLYAVRVRFPGAERVEIAGDFTDWEPIPLARVDAETWELRLPLTPGVHRLNVRADGGEWLVPAGARPEPGEFGGEVGVVIVRTP